MTEQTTPDGITKWTMDDPVSIVQQSQTQGDSVQAALDKRQRYDFVWADSTERTAQTGMVQGSRGYQFDNKSEYLFDNSNWRLTPSHAEFTASKQIPNGVGVTIGAFSIESTSSTNSTFIVPAGDGILTFVDPGVYAISTMSFVRNTADTTFLPVTGRAFVEIYTVTNTVQRMSINVGEDRGSVALPNLRVTVANQDIYFGVYQTTGGNALVKTTARITRIS